MEIKKIYTGFQSYIHYNYNNYRQQKQNIIMDNFKKSLSTNADLKLLENRLNNYFIKDAKGNVMGEVPQELLTRFYEVIEEKFNNTNYEKAINFETLGNQNAKFAKKQEEHLARLVQLGHKYFSPATAKKAIDNMRKRIELLNSETTKREAEQILDEIENTFTNLKKQYSTSEHARWYRTSKDVNSFAASIEALAQMLAGGSGTIHGAYAEYVVALMTAVTENKTKESIDEMLTAFEKNLENIGGAQTQATFTTTNYFGLIGDNQVDNVSTVIGGRKQIYDKDSNIVYTTNTTSDKVDVNIQFNGVELPASIKNINLQNKLYNNISLLSGRGLLALLDQEAKFVNHWLNTVPSRYGGPQSNNAPLKDINEANKDMKMLLAYRALVGGRKIATGGSSQKAKIFIINDNSQGKFKVFRMTDLLDDIEKNLNYLKITTYPDLFNLKNTWVGDSNYNANSAYKRVINLLTELNVMKLHISIDKNIIKYAF